MGHEGDKRRIKGGHWYPNIICMHNIVMGQIEILKNKCVGILFKALK